MAKARKLLIDNKYSECITQMRAPKLCLTHYPLPKDAGVDQKAKGKVARYILINVRVAVTKSKGKTQV